jgi:cytochrome c-type biogenesis protein CcmH
MKTGNVMKLPQLLLATALLAAFTVPFASAQTPTPNQVNEIAKELWCPLCNGVRLDNCELKACEQMREVIAEKLAAGDSREQIRAYFVQQYGDVVLGAPANVGFNRVVWILPVLAGVVALGWLIFFTRAGLRRRPKPAEATTFSGGQSPAMQDEYAKRVDDELQRYQ